MTFLLLLGPAFPLLTVIFNQITDSFQHHAPLGIVARLVKEIKVRQLQHGALSARNDAALLLATLNKYMSDVRIRQMNTKLLLHEYNRELAQCKYDGSDVCNDITCMQWYWMVFTMVQHS